MHTALADGIGAHTNVFFNIIHICELKRAPVGLLDNIHTCTLFPRVQMLKSFERRSVQVMRVYLQYAAQVDIALNGWLAFLFYSHSNKAKPSEELMSIGTRRDTRRVWDQRNRQVSTTQLLCL